MAASFLAPLNQTNPSLIAASIAIISATIFYFWAVKRSNKKLAPLPPGPLGLPILGYIPFLNGAPIHRKFAELSAKYGPIFKIWVGSQLYVVVSSPALAKQVLRDNESVFSSRELPLVGRICTYGGLDLACLPMGPDWNSMRKVLVREALSSPGLDGCYELRRREVVKALNEVEVGKPVGVFELAHKVVGNATLGMLWGGGGGGGVVGGDYGETREVGQRIMELMAKPNVSDLFPMLARFDLQGIGREAAELAERFDRIVSAMIRKRLDGGGEKKGGEIDKVDLLQVLLERRGSSGAGSPSLINICWQDVAVGGNENIASTIEWAMSELLKSDRAMKSVQQELDEIVGPDSLVEDHHLKDLKYLDAVIKETCRLYLALMNRTASRACTVGGYTVPQGSKVFVNSWAIHRDPQFWAEPSEFRPERFLDGGTFDFMGSSSSFRYVPFGSGRRICAGVSLAERLLKYVLGSLLHRFEWRLADGEEGGVDLSDDFTLFIKKKRPLVAVPASRLPAGLELLAY
ncbi:unnamed protein product [Linum tenue]|uniref:Uncharacterized protein n=1 Tax=Linum tenue TaxID=586396 RepID=A0AAV0R4N5_9ROSI|nr:unnamed protein product [Linum tenue]